MIHMNEKPKVLYFEAKLDIKTVMTLFSGDNSELTFHPLRYSPWSQNLILLALIPLHVYP